MGSFIQSSRYYFNDKDIADLFSHPAFTQRGLWQIAREQGVFLHRAETIDDLISYLRRFAFDWPTLQAIARRINTGENQERRMPYRIGVDLQPDAIEDALGKTKEKRTKTKREIYSITKTKDGLIDVDVAYIHVDPTRMAAMQREERHIHIEIENVCGKVEIQYNNNERADEIVEQFVSFIRGAVGENLPATKIELQSIRDPAIRTKFFFDLMHNIEGFRVIDVKDLKVDHRLPELKSETGAEDEEEGDQTEEEVEETEAFKGLVRSAILHGESLLTSELYNRLRETGYYIASATWTAKEKSGDERVVDFAAGFGDPVKGTGFAFDVLRVQRRSGKDETARPSPFQLFEKKRLQTLLAESCYVAYEKIVPSRGT